VLADFAPSDDQPAAIADLTTWIQAGGRVAVLVDATGTAKSATTAWLIDRVQPPTLVMAPNTALAAQLAVWQPVETWVFLPSE
jgi:excinuclease ABC subunit B